MDSFDDFEMKPLTEGLGFHKRQLNLKQSLQDSGALKESAAKIPTQSLPSSTAASAQARQSFSDLLKALDKPIGPKVAVTEPLPQTSASAPNKMRDAALALPPELERPWLPQPTPVREPQPKAPTPGVEKASKTLQKTVQNVGIRRGAHDQPVAMLERAATSFPAAILDAVMALALSLVFLVALMTVTRIDLAALILHSGIDMPTQLAFGVLFIVVVLMYTVVSRSFFGRTLGEWTFDLQMGDDQQHLSALYPLQVLWRSVVVILTGFITLPLLSLAADKDLLAPLTGLQLYRLR